MTIADQINSLFENPEIQQQCSTMSDPEDIRKLLSDNGINLTSEEMEELLLDIGENVSKLIPDDELSERDLDDVAGGGLAMALALGKGCALVCGVAGGLVGVAAVGALAYGGYRLYKKVKSKK